MISLGVKDAPIHCGTKLIQVVSPGACFFPMGEVNAPEPVVNISVGNLFQATL